MKARIKKLGQKSLSSWVIQDALYEVTQHNPETVHVHEHFYIIAPGQPRPVQCLVRDCNNIGGNGSEWELLTNVASDKDAYDRAMGVL